MAIPHLIGLDHAIDSSADHDEMTSAAAATSSDTDEKMEEIINDKIENSCILRPEYNKESSYYIPLSIQKIINDFGSGWLALRVVVISKLVLTIISQWFDGCAE